MHAPGRALCGVEVMKHVPGWDGGTGEDRWQKGPAGLVLEFSQVASGARTLGEMRGERKIQQGSITEGSFYCPRKDRAFGLKEEWAPFVSFPHCST